MPRTSADSTKSAPGSAVRTRATVSTCCRRPGRTRCGRAAGASRTTCSVSAPTALFIAVTTAPNDSMADVRSTAALTVRGGGPSPAIILARLQGSGAWGLS
ncbi:hypothetical protein ACBJ59_24845 [Nonomuraea sp. MTCD27]|uniref:hypothetical protein n=1 Tax=Nonomuraea sp. MTCD27 TaxID=1676747 RepID=UPI0035BEC52E